jgi:hypothetical protein
MWQKNRKLSSLIFEPGWPNEFVKKIAQNEAQAIICKFNANVCNQKLELQTSFIFKKLPKVSNHPIGGKPPNLVALIRTNCGILIFVLRSRFPVLRRCLVFNWCTYKRLKSSFNLEIIADASYVFNKVYFLPGWCGLVVSSPPATEETGGTYICVVISNPAIVYVEC